MPAGVARHCDFRPRAASWRRLLVTIGHTDDAPSLLRRLGLGSDWGLGHYDRIIDGEGVVCGPDGVTNFNRLRAALGRKARAKHSSMPSTCWRHRRQTAGSAVPVGAMRRLDQDQPGCASGDEDHGIVSGGSHDLQRPNCALTYN